MSETIQDLRARLDRAEEVREKIDARNALAWELRYNELQTGRELSQQALDLAQQVGYTLGIARSRRNRGYFLSQQSRYAEALEELLQARAIAEAERALEDQVLILWSLGAVYTRLTNYPAAIEVFLNLSDLCTQLDNRAYKAQALNGLGVVYEEMGEMEKALTNLQEALVLYESLGMRRDMGKALNNLTLVHRRLEHYDRALIYGQRAMTIAQETDHHILMCHCHNNLGTIYLNAGDLDQAMAHFEQSLSLSESLHYVYTQIYAQRHIGRVHWERGHLDGAIAYLHQALQTADAADAKSESFKCHQHLSQIYEAQGNLTEALAHYKHFHRLKEAVFNTKADQTIKSLQLIHDVESARREAELTREKNATLREYARELETSNAELNAFAHTVAHDLKTPLTATIGYSSMLEVQLADVLPEGALEKLHRITQIGYKMGNIIDGLLLLASVRQMDEVPSQPLDTGAIVHEAQTQLAPLLKDRQAEVTVPQRWPVARGYAPWIEEVWVNYLSNAAKYGGTPPQITLGWDRETSQPNTVRFWVQDRGPGITPEERARLFAPFERLDQADAVEGHGLGLSVVHRIVEKLGGRVGVESAPQMGSRFWFTLPEDPEM
jgi:signal transduction histidine kinase